MIEHFCFGFAFGWCGMQAILDKDSRIYSGVPAVLLLIGLIVSQAAFAQNQSQMGNAGYSNCKTRLCIDNVRRTVAGEKNLCTTDKACEGQN